MERRASHPEPSIEPTDSGFHGLSSSYTWILPKPTVLRVLPSNQGVITYHFVGFGDVWGGVLGQVGVSDNLGYLVLGSLQ